MSLSQTKDWTNSSKCGVTDSISIPDENNVVHLNTAVPKLTLDGNQRDGRVKDEPVADKLDIAGIPVRYRDITFEEIKRRGMPKESAWVDAFLKVHSYAHFLDKRIKDGDGLILFGNNGNLKTSLAVAVLRQYLDSGGYGRFMPMCTLAHKLRAMWSINAQEANNYHDKLVNTRLLVIDDLGAEDTQKDWIMTEIESIIAERYNNRRSTIITTNLNRKELTRTYSMRIMDRLREAAEVVEFKGKSLRKNLTLSEEIERDTPLEDKPVEPKDLLLEDL